ncbi:MAG: c-type cytochrome [Novosphingobium sp.]|uniref:c-type cytochrome n=1 Tax=Novosphingobium sp. TaxID=1874826 RepID=UPI002617AC9F|nr:c-type cytochrome [Novosphingobium sp.]MCP5386887.1 c-type cytochrome [Novosphingobium sp.]
MNARHALIPRARFLVAASFALCGTTFFAAPGDAVRGATIYTANCGSCHSLDANRVGPAHRGIYGRKAGSAPGYAYSTPVKNSRIIWNANNLDRWLRDPRSVIPGTKMAFRLTDAQKRADVIAYLRQQSAGVR